jgi:histidinol-phosphate aminotransferase
LPLYAGGVTLPTEAHGGLNLLELREANIDLARLIDFSVNVNPFGPSPLALAALRETDPSIYPDRHVLDLRDALAEANNLTPAHVLVGNGTAELIWLVAHACIKPGDTVLIIGPTFGEYERACHTVGAQVTYCNATRPTFALDIDEVVSRIKTLRPSLVFLCNPNNPTGLLLSDAQVERIANACDNGQLILDEAYRAFVGQKFFGPLPASNIIVLRSMTKDHGLAGIRLGYALAEPALVVSLRAYQPPWSINGPAQAAGLASLHDLNHLTHTLAATRELATQFRTDLTALGAQIVPATTHFILINVGNAASTKQKFLKHACLVRDCTSFGLPAYIRIGTRREDDNKKLIAIWNQIVSNNAENVIPNAVRNL